VATPFPPRFDHFKVSVQVIPDDLACGSTGKLPLLRFSVAAVFAACMRASAIFH
jgi:hypothetical protein